jgi:hypothetical protein
MSDCSKKFLKKFLVSHSTRWRGEWVGVRGGVYNFHIFR